MRPRIRDLLLLACLTVLGWRTGVGPGALSALGDFLGLPIPSAITDVWAALHSLYGPSSSVGEDPKTSAVKGYLTGSASPLLMPHTDVPHNDSVTTQPTDVLDKLFVNHDEMPALMATMLKGLIDTTRKNIRAAGVTGGNITLDHEASPVQTPSPLFAVACVRPRRLMRFDGGTDDRPAQDVTDEEVLVKLTRWAEELPTLVANDGEDLYLFERTQVTKFMDDMRCSPEWRYLQQPGHLKRFRQLGHLSPVTEALLAGSPVLGVHESVDASTRRFVCHVFCTCTCRVHVSIVSVSRLYVYTPRTIRLYMSVNH
mmetsp:Transcript_24413/g.60262  ORF Transcript_24413/g.60262 Transcript_24413/m.60262 type:complete len:313 (-) Transcript_24413:16-954(-)